MNNTSSNKLYYRVSGNGRPVVFLHGFLEDSSMWDELQFPQIKAVYIDLPGHGKSLFDTENERSLIHMAERVSSVIDDLGLNQYDVVGHSMGGYVALELKRMDARCNKVVLLNSNFWEDSATKKEDRNRVASIVCTNKSLFLYEAVPNLFLNPELYDKEVKQLIADAQKIPGASIANVSLAMRDRRNNRSLLEQQPGDFLIIQGQEDGIVSSEIMQSQLNNNKVVYRELTPCGHMAHFEKKEDVEQTIRAFLEKKNGNH